MRFPRFRIRTLMIVVAVIALDLAGLLSGSPVICTFCIITTLFAPFIVFFAYIAREIGINTLFR